MRDLLSKSSQKIKKPVTGMTNKSQEIGQIRKSDAVGKMPNELQPSLASNRYRWSESGERDTNTSFFRHSAKQFAPNPRGNTVLHDRCHEIVLLSSTPISFVEQINNIAVC